MNQELLALDSISLETLYRINNIQQPIKTFCFEPQEIIWVAAGNKVIGIRLIKREYVYMYLEIGLK
jgi:hypothetical protein